MTDTILIVETECAFRENLARRLVDGTRRVLVAAGGREAYEQIAAGGVDVVLLDLTGRMPDGLTTLASIKRCNPHTEVITIAGAGQTVLAIAAMKHGAFDHLADPFSVDVLNERIAAALQHRRRHAGCRRAPSAASGDRGGDVLLVDDESQLAETLAERLALRGLKARVASSGRQALRMAARRPPDAVVLDLQMPDLDGLEVLRRLRVRHPGLPVIILTGHGSADRAAAAVRMGARCCLQKPAEIEDLVQELVAVCRPCRDTVRGQGDPGDGDGKGDEEGG